ncbi:hypothetical protein GJAV_G00045940 [Gymnothorax javanicus]|nr:hypothetical protein GJAV_G00045940 [Gymnothorax javanicus]
MLDRKHVDNLLEHSDASFSDEFSNEQHVASGWEEAVQGWRRCDPMFCIFQSQKKCKKAKAADNGYHCLLCIDVKLSQDPECDLPASSVSLGANCILAQVHGDKCFAVPTKYRRPSSSPSAICCPSSELHGRSGLGNAAGYAEYRDEKTNEFQEMSDLVIQMPEQCPVVKEKEVTENVNALPPMQGSSLPRGRMELACSSVGASSLGSTESLTAENGSYSVPTTLEMCDEGKEATAGCRMGTKVSKDNNERLNDGRLPHARKDSLSLRVGIPERRATSSAALPREASLTGRKVKNVNQQRTSNKTHPSYGAGRAESNLPVVCGTRVPILQRFERLSRHSRDTMWN